MILSSISQVGDNCLAKSHDLTLTLTAVSEEKSLM
jgi:chromosome segregation ATPase